MNIIMRNVLNIIMIVCVCLSWGCTEGAQEREDGFLTIQLNSLFPSLSSSCVLSPKVSNTKSSLHVVHKHGPCSGNTESPDQDDILKRDQERVDSIHAKLSKEFKNQVKPNQATDLLAKDGNTIGSDNYFVTIGIGSPKRDMSLTFDTGSSLTWIQCEPCATSTSCYRQIEPIFNPSSSSSYSNVTCSSPVCASLRAGGRGSACSESTCGYIVGYGDKSYTQGLLAKERFTLTASDVFDGVNFGCGQNNQGLFKGAAGLLGLGRNMFSFPSQTATTYNNIFSYCLPSSGRYTGHLTFGAAGISNAIKYTPISSTRFLSHYGIDIVGIFVAGKKLEIPLTVFSKPGGIIDSGTVITRLPPKAYEALRSAFKENMSNYTTTVGQLLFDTCYDFTGVDLATVRIPKIAFAFNGDTVIDLDLVGSLYAFNRSSVCLAFAANGNDGDEAIFGNVQQKKMQVLYDGPGKQVGFAPNGCD